MNDIMHRDLRPDCGAGFPPEITALILKVVTLCVIVFLWICLSQLWEKDPEARPSFAACLEVLQGIQKVDEVFIFFFVALPLHDLGCCQRGRFSGRADSKTGLFLCNKKILFYMNIASASLGPRPQVLCIPILLRAMKDLVRQSTPIADRFPARGHLFLSRRARCGLLNVHLRMLVSQFPEILQLLLRRRVLLDLCLARQSRGIQFLSATMLSERYCRETKSET